MKALFICAAALAWTVSMGWAQDHAGHSHGEQSQKSGSGLSLNDGKKWPSDVSTRKGMQRFGEILDSAVASRDSSEMTREDFRELGERLQVAVNHILRECSMKGPAHDALHQFLTPLMQNVNELKEPDSPEPAASLEHLQAWTQKFAIYFE